MKENINLPIEGMQDIFGLRLRKIDFLNRKFADVVQRYGYEQLEVPLIEKASSFSEEVVGQSPWPEWDKRGCFYLKIHNYSSSFDCLESSTDALLIPEGTISVTRWLGNLLDTNTNFTLPLKIYYKLPCFRNELINNLSETKQRQFNQFGVEILGTKALVSDLEIIYLIHRLLTEVGVDGNKIRMRISDVGIFRKLISECKITHDDSIVLKEAMDTIAECRAGKFPERKERNVAIFVATLSKYSLNERQNKMWDLILRHKTGVVDSEFFSVFPKEYHEHLNKLKILCNQLNTNGINSTLDLCVVRSHEYYTGISFEVDVMDSKENYIEIAGGGRYDKLVGRFVENYPSDIIPSTGFAFGMERVVDMLNKLGLFNSTITFSSRLSFLESNADTLVVLKEDRNEDIVSLYFRAIKLIEENREKRFDIYVGENNQYEEYKRQRKIGKLQII